MQITKIPAVILLTAAVSLLFSSVAWADANNAAVTTWFKEYDEIRRSAEMTKSEKLQALSIGKNEPNQKNTNLASQMIEKYKSAAAAIKQLQPTAETKQLQEGYAQYFDSAAQHLTNYLQAQNEKPFPAKSFAQGKKKLTSLDKTNKRIDAQLRKKFKIPKHKHI